MFADSSLQQLREKIDLIEVLDRHIPLKRAGASYKACCPFHQEKTPSFVVKRGDTHYHCFGCGAHGDAISFLMQYNHLSFQEAIETLAELFHVRLEKEEVKEEGTPLAKLKETLEIAATFYHFYLLHHEEGQQGLAYLYQRNLSLDFIRRFNLGFAPYHGRLFFQWMEEKKVSRPLMQEAGLLNQSGREFFQGRILFPVYNARGGMVGFSGRKILEETFGGKYINTSETPLFKKSRLLFGLNLSRRQIAKQQRVLVVEGQIDCLRLIDGGFDWTVAALGTAFGQWHVKELTTLGVREAILLFDGDRAGLEAASKVGDLFQSVGVDVKVGRLPEGSDPDSLMRKEGKVGIDKVIQEAISYLHFQLKHLQEEETPAGKHQAITAMTKQIKGWEEPIMVHESLKRLAAITDLPPHLIGLTKPPRIEIKGIAIDPDRILELDLLRWLVLCGEEHPQFIKTAEHYLPAASFRDEECRHLYSLYLSGAHDLLTLGVHSPALIDEMMKRSINRERAERHFLDTVQKLADRQWLEERERIKQAIHSGQQSEEKVLELAREFDALGKKRPKINLCT